MATDQPEQPGSVSPGPVQAGHAVGDLGPQDAASKIGGVALHLQHLRRVREADVGRDRGGPDRALLDATVPAVSLGLRRGKMPLGAGG